MLLLRQPGVVPLHEDAAVFSGMLDGFSRQQVSRGLAKETIQMRRWQVERFQRFAGSYPWEWLPGDVEDFTTNLFSDPKPLARSTVRIYHLTLRAFCDFITDQRYGWVAECRARFGSVPTQVCFEWNTVAHTVDFEGTPGRRPLDYDELEALFAVADARVETLRQPGRKGGTKLLHKKPYARLLKAIDAPQEMQAALLRDFVEHWYAELARKGKDELWWYIYGDPVKHPLEMGSYFGRWCIEAVAAVKAAGLVDALSGPGPFTVFAPTNDAFGLLPAGTVDGLLKPEAKDTLVKVLTAHVVAGKLTAADLIKKAKANGGRYNMQTLSGDALTAVLRGSHVYIFDESGGAALVTIADVEQSNGVIHVIDTVLLPAS